MLQAILFTAASVSVVFSYEEGSSCAWNYDDHGASWLSDKFSECGWHCDDAAAGQSPIDIVPEKVVAVVTDVASLEPLSFSGYSAQDWQTMNNGHSLKLFPSAGGTTMVISGGITEGRRFCLDSVHIQWASEHTFSSERRAAEMHYVSYDCRFASITAALKQEGRNLAVVALTFDVCANENKWLDSLFDATAALSEPGGEPSEPFSWSPINPFLSLEADGESLSGDIDGADGAKSELFAFYAYLGSLTTPGCNPVVRWHLVKDPVCLTQNEMDELSAGKLYDSHGSVLHDLYRAQQDNPNHLYYLCQTGKSGPGCSAASSSTDIPADPILVTKTKSFFAANAYCAKHYGTHLAMLTEAQSRALSTVTGGGIWWVGLVYVDGALSVVDGSAPGRTISMITPLTSTCIGWGSGKYFGNEPCYASGHYFFCQHPVAGSQSSSTTTGATIGASLVLACASLSAVAAFAVCRGRAKVSHDVADPAYGSV